MRTREKIPENKILELFVKVEKSNTYTSAKIYKSLKEIDLNVYTLLHYGMDFSMS